MTDIVRKAAIEYRVAQIRECSALERLRKAQDELRAAEVEQRAATDMRRAAEHDFYNVSRLSQA